MWFGELFIERFPVESRWFVRGGGRGQVTIARMCFLSCKAPLFISLPTGHVELCGPLRLAYASSRFLLTVVKHSLACFFFFFEFVCETRACVSIIYIYIYM